MKLWDSFSKLFGKRSVTINLVFTSSAKSVLMLITAFSLMFMGGCEEQSRNSLWSQIKTLGQEKNHLQLENTKLQEENDDLRRQIETLSTLTPEIRLEAMTVLDKIKINPRSGLYDKDDDGKKETLIVYVQPFDDAGDTVKMPGKVDVQLWDLNADAGGAALLKEWQVQPEELKELWAGTIMTNYYRLKFDVSNMLEDIKNELTVKVTFTDYLTGKVLRKQIVVKNR